MLVPGPALLEFLVMVLILSLCNNCKSLWEAALSWKPHSVTGSFPSLAICIVTQHEKHYSSCFQFHLCPLVNNFCAESCFCLNYICEKTE